MDIFVKLEKNKKFVAVYNKYKGKKEEKNKKKRVSGKYIFEDRQGTKNIFGKMYLVD